MGKNGVVNVATCQFAITDTIRRNGLQARRQIQQAADMGADVAHFPETAISGYAGTHFDSWEGYDWEALAEENAAVCDAAAEAGIWVIIGSTHRLSGDHLPHNCAYVIAPDGSVVERYDKCFCTGGDLRFYSPADHLSVFKINGVTCGILICYDLRFPEIYRAYKKRGVQLLFQPFHNANKDGPTVHNIIMPTTVQARAASNYMWISAANACSYYQNWPSMLVRPDGTVVNTLRRHRSGVMVNEVDTHESLYDASGINRERAMKGILYSGELVKDPRSEDRTSL
ncbi:MAG: carbon-nitrogen hydrolase family protein [Armatimonadota bacterium]